jgi:hypothetical protein
MPRHLFRNTTSSDSKRSRSAASGANGFIFQYLKLHRQLWRMKRRIRDARRKAKTMLGLPSPGRPKGSVSRKLWSEQSLLIAVGIDYGAIPPSKIIRAMGLRIEVAGDPSPYRLVSRRAQAGRKILDELLPRERELWMKAMRRPNNKMVLLKAIQHASKH